MGSVTAYDTQGGRRYRARSWHPERKQAEQTTRTKKDALDHVAKVEVDKMRGDYVNPSAGKKTVVELAPAWLAKKRALKASAYVPLDSVARLRRTPLGIRARRRHQADRSGA